MPTKSENIVSNLSVFALFCLPIFAHKSTKKATVTACEKWEMRVPLKSECPIDKCFLHNGKIRADHCESARIIRELLCCFFLGNLLGEMRFIFAEHIVHHAFWSPVLKLRISLGFDTAKLILNTRIVRISTKRMMKIGPIRHIGQYTPELSCTHRNQIEKKIKLRKMCGIYAGDTNTPSWFLPIPAIYLIHIKSLQSQIS